MAATLDVSKEAVQRALTTIVAESDEKKITIENPVTEAIKAILLRLSDTLLVKKMIGEVLPRFPSLDGYEITKLWCESHSLILNPKGPKEPMNVDLTSNSLDIFNVILGRGSVSDDSSLSELLIKFDAQMKITEIFTTRSDTPATINIPNLSTDPSDPLYIKESGNRWALYCGPVKDHHDGGRCQVIDLFESSGSESGDKEPYVLVANLKKTQILWLPSCDKPKVEGPPGSRLRALILLLELSGAMTINYFGLFDAEAKKLYIWNNGSDPLDDMNSFEHLSGYHTLPDGHHELFFDCQPGCVYRLERLPEDPDRDEPLRCSWTTHDAIEVFENFYAFHVQLESQLAQLRDYQALRKARTENLGANSVAHIESPLDAIFFDIHRDMVMRSTYTYIQDSLDDLALGAQSQEDYPEMIRVYRLGLTLPNAGDISQVFKDRHSVWYYNLACAEAKMGRVDETLESLKRIRTDRKSLRNMVEREKSFDSIRDEPKFKEIFPSPEDDTEKEEEF